MRRTLSEGPCSGIVRTEAASRSLGRYRLLELLGRGGMGEVYRAYDPELDRMIAIKRLRYVSAADGRPRSRLMREARVAARLCHSNVVQIFDVGVDAVSQDAYIAMELVSGDTLRAWLRKPRDWREILEIFGQVGQGLLAAHEGSVVHRDFKPENVLLDDDGRAKVVDFGLAKPANARPTRNSEEEMALHPTESGAARWQPTEEDLPAVDGVMLTPVGARLGTPAYMPPEQMCSMPSDPRSDQYSFAVSLYEALTGYLPFDGVSSAKYAMAVLDGQVRPFPRRSPVPRRLRRAIMKAMAYRAEDRFATLEPLLEEIERARQGPRFRRRSLVAAMALGSLVTLGATLGVGAWLGADALAEPDRQVARGVPR